MMEGMIGQLKSAPDPEILVLIAWPLWGASLVFTRLYVITHSTGGRYDDDNAVLLVGQYIVSWEYNIVK